jgi:DNA invertase Pin-like site-specific DNA recombinase
MSKFKLFDNLIYLEKLIRQGRTGTPDELARKLSMSRSALYIIINEMKARGAKIKFCRTRKSFHYDGGIGMKIYFEMDGGADFH